jgi:hypothetical protein
LNIDQAPSVEERMMAFVEQEDTPRPNLDEEEQQEESAEEISEETVDEDVAAEETDEATDEEQTEEEPARKLKIKRNGEEIELDETEVVTLAQQGYDYTKKTQALAEERKQVESVAQALKAQEQTFQHQVQMQSALIQEIAKVTAIDDQLATFNGVDWQSLSDSDPVQAQKLFFQYSQLQTKRQELAGQLGMKQQQLQQVMAERIQQQTAAGLEQLQREIPDWGPEKARDIRDTGKNYGFTDAELSTVTDPRMVKVLHDAAQWRKLQSKQPVMKQKVAAASNPVKPGAKDSKTANQAAVKQTREALRKTGKSDYAAKLIERMI